MACCNFHWRNCRLSDIFVLEKHRVCLTFGSCLFGKYHMCPAMLFLSLQIKTVLRMLTKSLSSAWFYMELDSTTHGRNGHVIIIETSVMICPCRDVGSHI